MAAETFVQLWQRLLLYVPGLPIPLAKRFIKNSYNRILAAHYWSETFKDGEQILPDAYSDGTIDVTNGSAAVVGNGTAFAAAMVGRQLVVGDNLATYYTITAVGDVDAITLDRVYQGADASATTYSIAQYYIEFPSDLATLDDIRDKNQNWRLRRSFHQQNYLDLIDATRTNTGSPYMYVPAPPRVVAGVSYPRYEFYPKPAGGTHLLYRYTITPPLDANTDRILTMINPECVIYGALAELALWPGTPERQNPFFNAGVHENYQKLFESSLSDSELADLDRVQRMLIYESPGGPPVDANWLQSHGIPF